MSLSVPSNHDLIHISLWSSLKSRFNGGFTEMLNSTCTFTWLMQCSVYILQFCIINYLMCKYKKQMKTYSFRIMCAEKMDIYTYVFSVLVIVEPLHIKMYYSFLPTVMSQWKIMGAIIWKMRIHNLLVLISKFRLQMCNHSFYCSQRCV